MLVLTRRQDDTVVIDGRIEIKVLQVKGKSIRLGITAPSDVKILRGELKPYGVSENETPYEIERVIDITGTEVDLASLQQSLIAHAG